MTIQPRPIPRPPLWTGDASSSATLWEGSAIELAVDFEGNSAPCRRFVAHRHSQHLLEAFFSGDYPRSHARVPMDRHLFFVWLQCVFFFLPGTFCEVSHSLRGGATPSRSSSEKESLSQTKLMFPRSTYEPRSPTRDGARLKPAHTSWSEGVRVSH